MSRDAGSPLMRTLERCARLLASPGMALPKTSLGPIAAILVVIAGPRLAEWAIAGLAQRLHAFAPARDASAAFLAAYGQPSQSVLAATSGSLGEALLLLAIVRLWSGNVRDSLGLRPRSIGALHHAMLAAAVFCLWIPLSLASAALEGGASRPGRAGEAGAHWMLVLLGSVLVFPFSEELLYRGFLFPTLARTRIGFLGAAFASSGIWAAEHTQYPWPTLVELTLGGVIACWAVRRTGSIWAAFLAHAAWNADASWSLLARLAGLLARAGS